MSGAKYKVTHFGIDQILYRNLKIEMNKTNHPDIDALMKDIREKDFDGVCAAVWEMYWNGFFTIPQNYPVIAEIKQQNMRCAKKASHDERKRYFYRIRSF